ncbi:hypothetical protein [Sanguibacter suaedae]|uniref:Uncharacterized protein n=1 Tax=Sanguibacter suaedae TaxID=2795737 RepID=A0A934I2C9_9MICO|nr:hypothetical protein [Sanguibacter suaedae]MBI9114304.1 hypothetical protein [Sanguibacter suaedae]
MALPQKNTRIIRVPIVLDSEVDLECLQAQRAVDVRAAELLSTAADRIHIARAAAPSETEIDAANRIVDWDKAVIAELKATAEEKKAALEDVTAWSAVRALGRKTWADLVRRHPATLEDQKQWEADGGKGKAPYNEIELAKDLFHLA